MTRFNVTMNQALDLIYRAAKEGVGVVFCGSRLIVALLYACVDTPKFA